VGVLDSVLPGRQSTPTQRAVPAASGAVPVRTAELYAAARGGAATVAAPAGGGANVAAGVLAFAAVGVLVTMRFIFKGAVS
jgi:hypothetical protein